MYSTLLQRMRISCGRREGGQGTGVSKAAQAAAAAAAAARARARAPPPQGPRVRAVDPLVRAAQLQVHVRVRGHQRAAVLHAPLELHRARLAHCKGRRGGVCGAWRGRHARAAGERRKTHART
jgi:hypothetical protein